MKKLFTLILAAVMLVCMMVISVSAAPTIYVYDDFSDEEYSATVWEWQGLKFAMSEDGEYVSGDKAAVVLHGKLEGRDPVTGLHQGIAAVPNGVSTEIDFRIDYAYKEDSWIGLWYEVVPGLSNDAGEDTQEQKTAVVKIYPQTGDVMIDLGGEVLATGNVGAVATGEDAAWNTLGMNISASGGTVTAYYNHEAVVTAQIPNCPASCQSIVIPWNGDCAVSFDNFLSASPDYDLTQVYNSGTGDDTSAPAGDDTSAPAGEDTSAPAGEDTSAPAGEDTTSAQTNTNKPSNPQTGDTTVLFIIAAVAALGIAIVVKKIAAK